MQCRMSSLEKVERVTILIVSMPMDFLRWLPSMRWSVSEQMARDC